MNYTNLWEETLKEILEALSWEETKNYPNFHSLLSDSVREKSEHTSEDTPEVKGLGINPCHTSGTSFKQSYKNNGK